MKEKHKILSKLQLIEFTLESIHGRHINEDEIEVKKIEDISKWDASYEVTKNNELIIKVSCIATFEPKIFFCIETKFSVRYKIEDKVSSKEIENDLELLAQPCAARNTMLVGYVSEYITGTPFITIPFVDLGGHRKEEE